jgi:hypothetical protein
MKLLLGLVETVEAHCLGHRHQNPAVHLDRPRVPLATPRATVAHPLVRNSAESMRVASASLAGSPMASFAVASASPARCLWPVGPPRQRARMGGRPPRAVQAKWAALAEPATWVRVCAWESRPGSLLGFWFCVFLLLISQICLLCCKFHISIW